MRTDPRRHAVIPDAEDQELTILRGEVATLRARIEELEKALTHIAMAPSQDYNGDVLFYARLANAALKGEP